jgi:hypothetical protein
MNCYVTEPPGTRNVYRSFRVLFPGAQQHYHTDNLQLLGHPVTDAVIREMIKEALPSVGIFFYHL